MQSMKSTCPCMNAADSNHSSYKSLRLNIAIISASNNYE